MIAEKMLELIILRDLIREFNMGNNNIINVGENTFINSDKILERHNKLVFEFINPYVVNKP